MNQNGQLPWQQSAIIQHSQNLLHSYQHWLGQSLFDLTLPPEELPQELFEAPFVIFSHDAAADPILNYGNRKALELWEPNCQEFTQISSRKTAEELIQSEKNRLLADTSAKGFRNYTLKG